MDALKPVLARIAAGARLTEAEAEAAFDLVLSGAATAAQIGGLLIGMRVRGETAEELLGAARALRGRMIAVPAAREAIDVCGTGGDLAGTLNVSTAVTFVVAGAGVKVAKHGNRAASSRSGGADVLAALGVRLDPPLTRLPAILAAAGCVFLFAPRHHPGLAQAAAARAELGTRTLFNLVGPLANPAGVRCQLTGVFDPGWVETMARVLGALGTRRSWVVHGGGLDELGLGGPNQVAAQDGRNIRVFTLEAGALGLRGAPAADLAGGDAAENAGCLHDLLANAPPPGGHARRRHDAYRDTVLLNAAAALVVAGRTDDLSAALSLARAALDGGAALDALNRLRAEAEID